MAYKNNGPSSLRIGIDMLRATIHTIYGTLHFNVNVPREDMSGKTVIVTGANSGIGYHMALDLASMGATVYLACRTTQKGEATRDEILKLHPKADVRTTPSPLDAGSLESVHAFATAWGETPIDVFIHNAGIVSLPLEIKNRFTADGFEAVYQTNFLSQFLLTYLLESRLTSSARVVFTSSAVILYDSKMGKYDFATEQTKDTAELYFHDAAEGNPYPQGKFMQSLFALQLQDRFDRQHEGKGSGRLAFSFHPGLVQTNIFVNARGQSTEPNKKLDLFAKLMARIGISPAQGATTGVYLATTKDANAIEHHKGGFFDRKKRLFNETDRLGSKIRDRFWTRWSADAGIEWAA